MPLLDRDLAVANLHRIAKNVAEALGGTAEISDENVIPYPATVNHLRETELAVAVARDVAGQGSVDDSCPPDLRSEDFSFMLNQRPGNMILIGNGDSAYCHHPAYEFADDAIPFGISYWVKLAETSLARKGS